MASESKLKVASTTIISLTVFFTIVSLGIFGKQLTYYFEMVTEAERNVIHEKHSTYVDSMKSCVAFDTIMLLILPLYVAGTWYTQSGGCAHKVFQGIYFTFWLARFISGIVYLEGSSDWKRVKEFEHDTFEAEPEICEELVMIRKCAYVYSYIQTINYETFYIIFFSIFGIVLAPIMYILNRDKDNSYESREKGDVELNRKPQINY